MPSESICCNELFECTLCGECCKGFGGTYVTDKDIQRIASFCKIPERKFRKTYLQPSGNRLVLAQKEDGYCIFYKDSCTIHPVKPRMCRQWPFIESVLKDVANWNHMASCCPGINPNHPREIICMCVAKAIGKEN